MEASRRAKIEISKGLFTVLFDLNGLALHVFLPQGLTVKEYFILELCADCKQKKKKVIMNQPPYSLDLTPTDFFHFPKKPIMDFAP